MDTVTRDDKMRRQHVVGMLTVDVAFETFGDSEKFATLLVADRHVTLHRPEVVTLRDYMTEWLEKEGT